MDKRQFLEDWYRRVWMEGDLDAIDEFFAPRAGADGIMPDGQVGAEDFRALVPAMRDAVRNLVIEINRHKEIDDWIWAQFTARAIGAHDMREINAQGQVMVHIEDGKITEAYNVFDFLTLFSQSGQLPEDVFMLLLSGERLS